MEEKVLVYFNSDGTPWKPKGRIRKPSTSNGKRLSRPELEVRREKGIRMLQESQPIGAYPLTQGQVFQRHHVGFTQETAVCLNLVGWRSIRYGDQSSQWLSGLQILSPSFPDRNLLL